MFIALTELGVFFLMVLAGLEMRPRDLLTGSASSLVIAVSGLLTPLAGGFALGWVFLPESPAKLAQAAFLGTALAITAVRLPYESSWTSASSIQGQAGPSCLRPFSMTC